MRDRFDFEFVEFVELFNVKQTYDDNLQCFTNFINDFFVNENVFLNSRIE